MKIMRVSVLMLLFLFLFSIPAVAQSPLPTPSPEPTATPVPDPGDPPALEDPTDLTGVMIWLTGGGAGAFVAVWIEKQEWFQKVSGKYKPLVVLLLVAGVALIPQILLDVVPGDVWTFMQPYFSTIVTAVLLGYPASQVLHVVVNKHVQVL